MILAGTLRESIVIERPVEVRNELGEATQEWVEFARRRASVEMSGYTESLRMAQIGGAATWTVRLHYVTGLEAGMRVRWVSRANRILYISSVLEVDRMSEHSLICEERL